MHVYWRELKNTSSFPLQQSVLYFSFHFSTQAYSIDLVCLCMFPTPILIAFHAPKNNPHYTCMTLRITCIIITFLGKITKESQNPCILHLHILIEKYLPLQSCTVIVVCITHVLLWMKKGFQQFNNNIKTVMLFKRALFVVHTFCKDLMWPKRTLKWKWLTTFYPKSAVDGAMWLFISTLIMCCSK